MLKTIKMRDILNVLTQNFLYSRIIFLMKIIAFNLL